MPTKRNVLIEMRHPRAINMAAARAPAASLRFDETFATVALDAHEDHPQGTHLARGHVDHEEIEGLEAHPDVVKVWSDPEIHMFSATGGHSPAPGKTDFPCPLPPCDCDYHVAKGGIADVASCTGADRLWQAGIRGAGIAIGIVGGGITAEGRPISQQDTDNQNWSGKLIPSVTNGWPSDWGTTGVALEWHGNAMATGALGMAPDAELYDMRLVGGSEAVSTRSMISDAIAAFDWGIAQFKATGKPQVLNNSWGIYAKDSAPDYATDPRHPFTRKVAQAIDAGMVILFAAGNCGGTCPAGMCGTDVGPGLSIWGANGAPEVMCIAAANTLGQYVGYGSQGPAALDKDKPDFCGISHYKGYTDCDYGTSSACAIASGIAALLKCADPAATPAAIKQCLERTAHQIDGGSWNPYSGYGIVRAEEALKALHAQPSA